MVKYYGSVASVLFMFFTKMTFKIFIISYEINVMKSTHTRAERERREREGGRKREREKGREREKFIYFVIMQLAFRA